MFLFCRSCDWEQDDYWTEQYNPLRSLLDWEHTLLVRDLDAPFHEETDKSVREVLCSEIYRAIQKTQGMNYRTLEELRTKNPEGVCPACGSNLLSMD